MHLFIFRGENQLSTGIFCTSERVKKMRFFYFSSWFLLKHSRVGRCTLIDLINHFQQVTLPFSKHKFTFGGGSDLACDFWCCICFGFLLSWNEIYYQLFHIEHVFFHVYLNRLLTTHCPTNVRNFSFISALMLGSFSSLHKWINKCIDQRLDWMWFIAY